jgi:hypothetical protein
MINICLVECTIYASTYIYLDPLLLCQVLVFLQEDVLRAGHGERCHDEIFLWQSPGRYVSGVVSVEEAKWEWVQVQVGLGSEVVKAAKGRGFDEGYCIEDRL